MKVLSKSRFKIGADCPNKLYYTFHKEEFPSTKEEDTFLQALAQGGFQVEELARMHYPGGHLIDNPHYDYQGAVDRTAALLLQENVTIFEAAFLWDGLFIRTDILVKKGNHLDLIEVKAKLFDPTDPYFFVGKKGGLVSSWKPYLFDLAFQKYVLTKSAPSSTVTAHLMMADKTKKASKDGLNQLFRIPSGKNADPRKDLLKRVHLLEEVGDSVLTVKNMNSLIEDILEGKYEVLPKYPFKEAVKYLASVYQSGQYPNWPTNYSTCKGCEFRATKEQLASGKKSGFQECMRKQHGWTDSQCSEPSIFEIWNFRSKVVPILFQENRLLMHQLSEEDLAPDYCATEISSSERRWIQVKHTVEENNAIHCVKEELKRTMGQWKFPLHFIDFETSGVALPFTKGRRPYEQVAFQFSHHVLGEDGSVCHQTEYLSSQPGEFPNFEFARALKSALGGDSGTIFKFASHENTIVNAIIEQLTESKEADKEELIHFLKDISTSKKDSAAQWEGTRDMVDLRKVVLSYYYNPLTKGSNSIKAVLPAVLQACTYLKDKYAKPLSENGVSSLNFPDTHTWLKDATQAFVSPYKMLPPLFDGWAEEEKEELISEMEGIADGGMALTAYAKLQYVDMTDKERDELTSGLKKYCELDTLAMVMIYEHFREIVQA
jgi:hypothetical protein